PSPYQAPPNRSWRVTSGRRAPSPRVPCVAQRAPDAQLAACARRHATARDRCFVELALTGCDGLVGILPVHTAVALLVAAETNNDPRCSAASSTSHRFARHPHHLRRLAPGA